MQDPRQAQNSPNPPLPHHGRASTDPQMGQNSLPEPEPGRPSGRPLAHAPRRFRLSPGPWAGVRGLSMRRPRRAASPRRGWRSILAALRAASLGHRSFTSLIPALRACPAWRSPAPCWPPRPQHQGPMGRRGRPGTASPGGPGNLTAPEGEPILTLQSRVTCVNAT
jgi:hypothetical protein